MSERLLVTTAASEVTTLHVWWDRDLYVIVAIIINLTMFANVYVPVDLFA